jgi:hypothetical protein
MNLVSVDRPRNELYVILKLATSNCMYSVQKFSRVPKVIGRVIWLMGVAATLGTIPWNGARWNAVQIWIAPSG